MMMIREFLAKHGIKVIHDYDNTLKLDGNDFDAINYYLDMLNKHEKLRFNLIKELMLVDPDIKFDIEERAAIMNMPLNDEALDRVISMKIRRDFGKIT